MEANKKWCLGTLSILLVILSVIGAVNFIADPYEQYRSIDPPTAYMDSRMFGIQRQLVPGLAKNKNYDTVLVGSSMSEYFSTGYIDKTLGVKSVKLSMSGGTTYEIKNALDTAIKTGKVKTALVSVDVYMFNRPIIETSASMPYYLYDTNKLNDVKYLLNYDVLKKDSIPLLLDEMKEDKPFDWNKLYLDPEKFNFSKETVMQHYEEPLSMVEAEKEKSVPTEDMLKIDFDKDKSLQTMRINFNANLLSVIKANPQIQFKIIYPPNSILFWDRASRTSALRIQVAFKKYIYEVLRDYKNVELYDFQDVKEITFNLNNYKDRSHYKPEVCNYMIDCIKNNKEKLTDSNYLDKIKDLIDQSKNFSLDQVK